MERMSRTGWIEIISGVMFAGKSEELMRRVRRATLARKTVQVFKSQLDERYGIREVISHDQGRLAAHAVSASAELMARVRGDSDVVAIDEIQFLDDGVVGVVNGLADRGVRVIAAGTDMDFRGRPFGSMGALLAVAEKVDKLHAICVRCGEPATRNQRLVDGRPAPAEGPTIQVGGLESTNPVAVRATRYRRWAARRRCWSDPRQPTQPRSRSLRSSAATLRRRESGQTGCPRAARRSASRNAVVWRTSG